MTQGFVCIYDMGNMPSIKPMAVRLYGSDHATVTSITIRNSPQTHLKFDNINVSSPADSSNTDGIHLQNSQDVFINSINLACGDDCVSIQTGCSNVSIQNVNCGAGHGISIGGLGRDNTKACVSNVTVRDSTMSKTMTGVRIKTWQGGSGAARGIKFFNIQVSEVKTPIMIDQFYCDKTKCQNRTSAVAVSGIDYVNIRGTFTVKPVHFACCDSIPCTNISLATINLEAAQGSKSNDHFCREACGELRTTSTVPPLTDCLQKGMPSNTSFRSNLESCRA
ncbi:hypothetical protein CJ030_MR6G015583 [Morella rubra]|uniref:Polygalacturonase n=1 Tax=Morella rubra TaxID=262757 RepID=A0A6A1VBI2_9ROSI|nr:hypothetical protein CJ030_MR6G015583 [Morella rubra]